MKQTINIITIALFAGLFSCQSGQKTMNPNIEIHGKLKEIMMQNQLQARVQLTDLDLGPKSYGLGALEGLAGEIMILEGETTISKSTKDKVSVEKATNHGAALLVSTSVEDWTSTKLPSFSDLKALESIIELKAQEQSLNPDEVIPFMIKGNANRIGWHIINASEATEQTHDAYKAAGNSGITENEAIKILGFFSKEHEGIFTHHGSYLHMHFINESENIMGHIDELMAQSELELLLPKNYQP